MNTDAVDQTPTTDAPATPRPSRPAPRYTRDLDGAVVCSVSDAAAHFGVSRRTIYNWIHAGKVGCRVLPSGQPRVVVTQMTAAQESVRE